MDGCGRCVCKWDWMSVHVSLDNTVHYQYDLALFMTLFFFNCLHLFRVAVSGIQHILQRFIQKISCLKGLISVSWEDFYK